MMAIQGCCERGTEERSEGGVGDIVLEGFLEEVVMSLEGLVGIT